MDQSKTNGPSKKPSRSDKASAKRELELINAWKRGDPAAGRKLVQTFLPFVVSIAVEYRRWNTQLEDIVQHGCLGLLRAAERFDAGRQVRLVTYAGYWIRAEIRDHVLRTYRIVRLGTTKSERKAVRHYRATLEKEPAALARASGLSLRRAEALLPLLVCCDASFEAPLAQGTVAPRERMIASDPSPEECAVRSLDNARTRKLIERALSELTTREQVIARERWLFEEPTTLEALGTRFGVSKERVRQIEDRTREKLRARLEALEVA